MPVHELFRNPSAGQPRGEDEAEARIHLKDLSSPSEIAAFHSSLPNFMPTPLIPHPELASALGVSKVFIKAETSRLGLPAYKILGASYAIYRYLRRILPVPDEETTTLEQVAAAAQKACVKLCCATDGNHGRAVAYMAQLLGLDATVFAPDFVPEHTIELIESHGVDVWRVVGSYQEAEKQALRQTQQDSMYHLIQDNAIAELDDDSIVTWISAGYRTIVHELDATLALHNLSPSLIVVPVGVGSLAHSVSTHYSSPPRPKLLTIEPTTAASLLASLKAGKKTDITTTPTILTGLNCGSVSALAFPRLQQTIDFAATVSDYDAHEGVLELRKIGIDAGPIAGACVSALRGLKAEELGLDRHSVVVVIATEGRREYEVPKKPRVR